MDPSLDIEEIKIKNFNKKLSSELDYFNDSKNINIFTNIQDLDMNERITTLQYLLNVPVKKIDTLQQQKDNMFKEIDKYTYKKQWNKLATFHKIVKIKEYIKEAIIYEEIQNELILKLTKYAEENSINSKKYVVYDPNSEKILSMPCIIIEADKKTYQLKYI